MDLNDLTVLTCTFNNNRLTKCMIMSLVKQLDFLPPVVIMDNGTNEFCSDDMKEMFTVIDNTNFKITKNYNQISRNHCASIDYALKNYIKTKYVLLCDNDILFKPTIKELIKNLKDIDACGEVEKSKRGLRLFPFFCIIDVEKMKKDGINYFDENDCMNNLETVFDETGNWKSNRILSSSLCGLDTGGSFLKEIRKQKWNIETIKLNDFITHFASASWNPHVKKNVCDWLSKNRQLFSFKEK